MSEHEPNSSAPDATSNELPADSDSPSKDARTMAMLCHLLGIFLSFIGPLLIWLLKKDESPFIDDQGKEALNWEITMLIALAVSTMLIFVIIGVILLPAVWIVHLVFSIIATIKANEGERYRYPFAIRLIK